MRQIGSKSLLVMMLGCAAGAMPLQAQNFPIKPIRWVVPFAPGGPADAVARIIAPKTAERLGQPIIVESRAGASGNLGSETVLKAAPDGYTLLYATPGIVTNPHFVKGSPDPREFSAISRFTISSIVLLASNNFTPSSVPEVIQSIRARPGGVSCASSGALPTVGCELLRAYARVEMIQVLYKGNATAMNALMSGEVNLLFDPVSSSLGPIKSGKVKLVASLNQRRGGPVYPELPTAAEAYPGFWFDGWTGALGPGNMPREVVMRLNREFNAAIASPEISRVLTNLGLQIVNDSPEAFAERIRADLQKYGKITADAGIRPE